MVDGRRRYDEVGKGEVDREVQVVTFCVYLFTRDCARGKVAAPRVRGTYSGWSLHCPIGGYGLITYVVIAPSSNWSFGGASGKGFEICTLCHQQQQHGKRRIDCSVLIPQAAASSSSSSRTTGSGLLKQATLYFLSSRTLVRRLQCHQCHPLECKHCNPLCPLPPWPTGPPQPAWNCPLLLLQPACNCPFLLISATFTPSDNKPPAISHPFP